MSEPDDLRGNARVTVAVPAVDRLRGRLRDGPPDGPGDVSAGDRPAPNPAPDATGVAFEGTRSDERRRLRALGRGEGIEVSPEALDTVVEARSFAATAVYRRIAGFNEELSDFFAGVRPTLADALRGELLNPDGSPARQLIVEVLRPQYSSAEAVGEINWTPRQAVTDRRGMFSVPLSPVPAPQAGLMVRLRGRNAVLDLPVQRVDALDGDIGLTVLEATLLPLQRSVVGELRDLFPVDPDDAVENPDDFRSDQPPLVIGEGDCAAAYRTEGGAVTRFRYSVLYRLVDPLVAPMGLRRVRTNPQGDTVATIPGFLPAAASFDADAYIANLESGDGAWQFAERVPIEEPIDVEAFLDGLVDTPEDIPKAATLGLGYVTKMRVLGVNQGMSLGRLVYSLPLAPGEEQQIAVFEQNERLSVRDRESLTVEEQQEFEESRDTSLDATFSSALDELIEGESRFSSESSTNAKGRSSGFGAGFGGGGIIGKAAGKLFGGISGGFSGGFSNSASSSSGDASASENTSRDFLSETQENFSSALERKASLKRSSSRTSVRLANASDRQTATTKFIANRNHCHALTMQWFEVLRDYSIDTRIDGVQLVAFVPMQLLRFRVSALPTLPPNPTRGVLTTRYRPLVDHADAIRAALPHRRYVRALDLLEDFYADGSIEPQGTPSTQQDVMTFRVTGGFLPNDDLSVVAVTKGGNRIGPVQISGSPVDIDEAGTRKARGRNELISWLRDARRTGARTYSGTLPLPRSVAPSDLARIELRRSTGSFSYSFLGDAVDYLDILEIIKDLGSRQEREESVTTTLAAAEFEDFVGAPSIHNLSATLNAASDEPTDLVDSVIGANLPPVLHLPVVTQENVIANRELRLIEDLYQHVIRNTVGYSKAVWMGMTEEERAILLERYTIGVPEGGLTDAASEIPLLSAVANKVLGFYGNMMIMPFAIPQALAQETGLTSGRIQDAILRFHREGFRPLRRQVSLPTRGLLGEAVLGRCNACEVVDHRRFWNWQDSPTPAPVSQMPTFPQASGDIFSAAAPSALATSPPPTNLTIAGGDVGSGAGAAATPTGALAEIVKAVPDLARSGTDLSGLSNLQSLLEKDSESAASGRNQAIESSADLTKDLVAKAVMLATAASSQQTGAATPARAEAAAAQQGAGETGNAQVAEFQQQASAIAGNAEPLSFLAFSQGQNSVAYARQVVAQLFEGKAGLNAANTAIPTAQMLAAFQAVAGDDGNGVDLRGGANAFLANLSDLDQFLAPSGEVLRPVGDADQ